MAEVVFMCGTITKSDIVEQFIEDPLYSKCIVHNLEQYLFTESILSMEKQNLYNTTLTGWILDRNDSTIRNYFRTDLAYYVKPRKHGKYFRLNWINIFRLKMVTVLIERLGSTTEQILSEIKRYDSGSSSDDLSEKSLIEEIEKGEWATTVKSEIKSLEYKELANLISLLEKKIDNYFEILKSENEIFMLNYMIEKEFGYIREIKSQQENLSLTEIFKLLVKSIKNNKNNQSIVSRVFNKEGANTDEAELAIANIEHLKEKYSEITDGKIKEHLANIDQFEQRKDELYKKRLSIM